MIARGWPGIRHGAIMVGCSSIAFAPVASRAIIPRNDTAAKQWHAPRSCIFTHNPVPTSPESLKKGREVFQARCIGCHGEAGHGDGPDASQLRVRPARLSAERVQSESDGLLWW